MLTVGRHSSTCSWVVSLTSTSSSPSRVRALVPIPIDMVVLVWLLLALDSGEAEVLPSPEPRSILAVGSVRGIRVGWERGWGVGVLVVEDDKDPSDWLSGGRL